MIVVNVRGVPRPQPRPRFVRGRVISTADANAKRWVLQVESASRRATAATGKLDGAVAVSIDFTLPTDNTSRHGTPHTSRPDADNLAKLVLDCIMRAGLIGDDAAVSSLTVRKTWGDTSHAGADVTVAPDSRFPTPPDMERPDWI